MRKLINSTYMTLDGDFQNMRDWHFGYFSEDAARTAGEQMLGSDALIMGRDTYDGFFPAWSARSDTDNGADHMNSVKKYVVSNTLTNPEWNNTEVLSGDIVSQVRAIKERAGKDILQYGFGPVTRLLLDAGLIDEVQIWLHPVLSGKATPENLLYRDATQTHFTLVGTDILSTGVIILTYAPKAKA
jgi:dihydrofolate reductase